VQYFSRRTTAGAKLGSADLYEYFVDNFWFKAAGLEQETINEPLRGEHKADVVIIGGGYAGLSSAFHIQERFPDKKITLLEGACCGYGASGRNGGFCVSGDLLGDPTGLDDEGIQKRIDVSYYGLRQIRRLVNEHGVDCDLMENGRVMLAMTEEEARWLETAEQGMKAFGLESTLLQGVSLEAEIRSPRFIAGLLLPDDANLNPAKLARGLKRVVEARGVEIRERSVVTRIDPGKVHRVETERGRIDAPVIVLAMNAYAPKLGLFRNRVFPLCSYIIATRPLSPEQWESIGLRQRRGFSDMLPSQFFYAAPSADGRIVIGGVEFPYYRNDGLSRGFNASVRDALIGRLLDDVFPQLEGIEIDHSWGGTMSGTRDLTPSVGVLGPYRNVYYGVGFFEGVPTAQTAGRIIGDLMAGERNAFTENEIVNRKIPYAGPQLVRNIAVPAVKILMTRFGVGRNLIRERA
jgi:glycine/D-amino acid oxidase-like deaminating enzyme